MKKMLFVFAILTIALALFAPSPVAAAAPAQQIDPLCLLEKIVSGEGVSWATNLDTSILIHLDGGPEAVALSKYLESQGWKNLAHANFKGRIENWNRPEGWKPPSSCNDNNGQSAGGESAGAKFSRLVPSVLGVFVLGLIGIMLGGRRRLSPATG